MLPNTATWKKLAVKAKNGQKSPDRAEYHGKLAITFISPKNKVPFHIQFIKVVAGWDGAWYAQTCPMGHLGRRRSEVFQRGP